MGLKCETTSDTGGINTELLKCSTDKIYSNFIWIINKYLNLHMVSKDWKRIIYHLFIKKGIKSISKLQINISDQYFKSGIKKNC